MIREALNFLTDLGVSAAKPQLVEHEGRQFHKGELTEIEDACLDSISLSSLSGMVEYVKSQFDMVVHANKLMIHVCSPSKVVLLGPLKDKTVARYEYAATSFMRDGLEYGHRYSPEQFNMALQCHVEDKLDRSRLLKMSGNIGCEKSMTSHDDGITQTVSVRKGAVIEEKSDVPNPVRLMPYRTFAEVAQPESPFVFRVHDNGPDKLPSLSLTECDGGVWKNQAMMNIKTYLSEHLKDVTILA